MLTINFFNELSNRIKAQLIVAAILALISKVKPGEDFDKSGELKDKPKGQQFGKYRVFTVNDYVQVVIVTGRGKAMAFLCNPENENITEAVIGDESDATKGVVYPAVSSLCNENGINFDVVQYADIVAMLTSEVVEHEEPVAECEEPGIKVTDEVLV